MKRLFPPLCLLAALQTKSVTAPCFAQRESVIAAGREEDFEATLFLVKQDTRGKRMPYDPHCSPAFCGILLTVYDKCDGRSYMVAVHTPVVLSGTWLSPDLLILSCSDVYISGGTF